MLTIRHMRGQKFTIQIDDGAIRMTGREASIINQLPRFLLDVNGCLDLVVADNYSNAMWMSISEEIPDEVIQAVRASKYVRYAWDLMDSSHYLLWGQSDIGLGGWTAPDGTCGWDHTFQEIEIPAYVRERAFDRAASTVRGNLSPELLKQLRTEWDNKIIVRHRRTGAAYLCFERSFLRLSSPFSSVEEAVDFLVKDA